MPSLGAPVAGLALLASIVFGAAQSLAAAEKPVPGSGMAGSNRSLGDGDKSKVAPKDQVGKSLGNATFTGTRWQLENGEPSYKISEDGTVDWATYEGFKRYHSECHTCHGPNGLGSTFAPALADSLKTMSYDKFKEVVSSGRTFSDRVMPAFASNPNVMCYVDDLYTYLKARADGVLPAGRSHVNEHVAKTKDAQEYEKACME